MEYKGEGGGGVQGRLGGLWVGEALRLRIFSVTRFSPAVSLSLGM